MKTKTINAVLGKKIDEWIASIEDERLRKRLDGHVIVTGGCIASMLLREKVNDYDVYVDNYDLCFDLTNYYVTKFKSLRRAAGGKKVPITVMEEPAPMYGEFVEPNKRIKIVVKSAGVASDDDSAVDYEYFESQPPEEAQAYVGEVMRDVGEIEDKYEEEQEKVQDNETEGYLPVFLSTNAITLSGKIQIIIRFIGTPEEIHANYDFVHCTNYWTSKTGTVLNQAALESLLTKELRYVGSRYPVCSIIRTRKFIQRQWTINAGQYVKMIFQASQLDLTDVKVLEDQLTGVDVAYFSEVIRLLEEKNKTRIDSTYLIEIINRLF